MSERIIAQSMAARRSSAVAKHTPPNTSIAAAAETMDVLFRFMTDVT
ncbi:MAG TPA: hypothetical protein VH702_01565 [Vicinamibacterales bacterium]